MRKRKLLFLLMLVLACAFTAPAFALQMDMTNDEGSIFNQGYLAKIKAEGTVDKIDSANYTGLVLVCNTDLQRNTAVEDGEAGKWIHYGRGLVFASATTAVGNYFYSNTSGQAVPTATYQKGVFAQSIAAREGAGLVLAFIFNPSLHTTIGTLTFADGSITDSGGTIDFDDEHLTTTGNITGAAGTFTTLAASGQITSTLATGTAPFSIASTTKVANLDVDKLDSADWAAPASIGSGTPAAGAFTTLAASGIFDLNNILDLDTTINDGTAAASITDTTADITTAMHLLKLTYSGDTADVDAGGIIFSDAGGTLFEVKFDGLIETAGGVTLDDGTGDSPHLILKDATDTYAELYVVDNSYLVIDLNNLTDDKVFLDGVNPRVYFDDTTRYIGTVGTNMYVQANGIIYLRPNNGVSGEVWIQAFPQADNHDIVFADRSSVVKAYFDTGDGTFYMDGALMLQEMAAAIADTASYGQFWVETATPNLPRFTDDAGTDFDIAVSSATTGGAGSAGGGNQYVEISIGGTVYKVLHDGTV